MKNTPEVAKNTPEDALRNLSKKSYLSPPRFIASPLREEDYRQYDAVLQVVSDADIVDDVTRSDVARTAKIKRGQINNLPFAALFAAATKKRRGKIQHSIMLPDGTAVARCVLKKEDCNFAMMESLRRQLVPLLGGGSVAIDIRVQSLLDKAAAEWTKKLSLAQKEKVKQLSWQVWLKQSHPLHPLTEYAESATADSSLTINTAWRGGVNAANVSLLWRQVKMQNVWRTSLRMAAMSSYTAQAAAAQLPGDSVSSPTLTIAGGGAASTNMTAAAECNTLARLLGRLPPNVLTVSAFAKTASMLAKQHGIKVISYNAAALRKMGAGAILAVGAGSPPMESPRIVRLQYTPLKNNLQKNLPKNQKNNIPRAALVGKGVCYDTGGINVKPARYMRGMKGDMAGAAAVLAATLMAAKTKLPLQIDAYLVLAENSISAESYRPDEVVRALNGKRIEVVHSDAEGRMLLADTLALASDNKQAGKNLAPHVMVSMATLTGTMITALGERISGVFASPPRLWNLAESAAKISGERLCCFPLPTDYAHKLKSNVADIKQCLETGDADHIYAALFLREFVGKDLPWLHVDLSSANCEGGLAAATGPETGAGAHWALALLQQMAILGVKGIAKCTQLDEQ